MKLVILCPFGVRTGGPEAQYQLSDMLLQQGFDAYFWLLTDPDLATLRDFVRNGQNLSSIQLNIPERANAVEDYRRYRIRPFPQYNPHERMLFIVPEIYVWLLPLLLPQQVMIWWLSVDNAFRPLSEVNSNFLRLPLVHHAAQSEFALRFVRALGVSGSMLSDYSVVELPPDLPALGDRPKTVAICAGHKISVNLDPLCQQIAERCPEANVVRIANMSKADVCAVLAQARVFVDLGKFPGKDRMVREALLLGANPIIANCGAGAISQDFPVPPMYRVDPLASANIAALCGHMLEYPEAHAPHFAAFRNDVAAEKSRFAAEVLQTFSGFIA